MVSPKRLLIVNRGEIVKRIAQTCMAMGIEPVCFACLGEDHRGVMCLSSIPLSGETLQETFLNIDKIIELIKNNKIDYVHPGYGFLSENQEFAEKVIGLGVKWVGPDPLHIHQMGSKIEAKLIAEKAGVSVLPWHYFYEIPEKSQLIKDCEKIGYPLIVKASGGGGGKGMRIVRAAKDLYEAVQMCSQEAANSFKSSAILLEKYIETPRHLEVQVFGDGQGNITHFYDRECSVQRRYQKIIEEAPVKNVPENVRSGMLADAIKLTSHIKYKNAGTVEFVYDGKTFYFIEINTRLQVEHSVTEMITGYDLVELQIKTADNIALVKQESIKAFGHAIEVRIYAEDCYQNFMPQSGTVKKVEFPNLHQVRVDSRLYNVYELKSYFDPMIAKISVYDTCKEKTILRLLNALSESVLLGVNHNINFLKFILSLSEFNDGQIFTNSIEKKLMKQFLEIQENPQHIELILKTLLSENHHELECNIGLTELKQTSLFEKIVL